MFAGVCLRAPLVRFGLAELEHFLQGEGEDRDEDAVHGCRSEHHDRIGHERYRQAQAIERYADDERKGVAERKVVTSGLRSTLPAMRIGTWIRRPQASAPSISEGMLTQGVALSIGI